MSARGRAALVLALLASAPASAADPSKPKAPSEQSERSRVGPASPRQGPAARLAKALGRRWRVETSGLAPGTLCLALGEGTAAGRPVLVVSELEAVPDDLSAPGAAAFLAGRLGARGLAEAVLAVDPGGAEVSARATGEGPPALIRARVLPGNPAYLLTLAAPEGVFRGAWDEVRAAADLALAARAD